MVFWICAICASFSVWMYVACACICLQDPVPESGQLWMGYGAQVGLYGSRLPPAAQAAACDCVWVVCWFSCARGMRQVPQTPKRQQGECKGRCARVVGRGGSRGFANERSKHAAAQGRLAKPPRCAERRGHWPCSGGGLARVRLRVALNTRGVRARLRGACTRCAGHPGPAPHLLQLNLQLSAGGLGVGLRARFVSGGTKPAAGRSGCSSSRPTAPRARTPRSPRGQPPTAASRGVAQPAAA